MITTMFQAIGVVLTLLVIVVIAVVSMYLSYILGIGIILITLSFVVYHVLSTLKCRK